MIRLEDLDIPKLTKVAESGDGCALRESIENMFYEERLSALKQIEQQNKVNRAANPSVPELFGFPSAPETFYLGGMNLAIRRENRSFFQPNPGIYKDRFVVTTGEHISYCETWDLKDWTKQRTGGKAPRA